MRFSYLFVVTFGRSGSTLLQGVLNTAPRTLIRGENNGFLYGLYLSWKTLADPKVRHVFGSAKNPWYGFDNFSRRQFEEDIRNITTRFLLGPENALKYDCLGFKEIRYLDIEDRGDYLDFILSVFPNSAIVFHIRDPQETVTSSWWRKADKTETVRRMNGFIEFARDYHESHVQNTILTSHEKITDAERTDIIRLFKFCGARINLDKIEEVLAMEHSIGNRNFQKD